MIIKKILTITILFFGLFLSTGCSSKNTQPENRESEKTEKNIMIQHNDLIQKQKATSVTEVK